MKAFLVVWFLLGIGSVPAQSIIDPGIDRLISRYVQKHKNRSLVLGVIRGEEMEIKGYGYVGMQNDFVPDESTIFEIGSMTSVFTTTLMMLESQKGRFAIDEPINLYLPKDIQAPSYLPFICRVEDSPALTAGGEDRMKMVCEPDPMGTPLSISFCDLASHTSGLPSQPKGFYSWNPFKWLGSHRKDPYHDLSRYQLYESLYGQVLSLPPGAFYQYSDAGMALLGNIVADNSGDSYINLLRERLLDPLGMKNTDVEVSAAKVWKFAPAHNKRGKITEHWHFDGMIPASGLRSTAGDLIRFLKMNLETDESEIGRALQQIQQARIDVPRYKTGRETMGGYGWFTSILSEKSNLPVHWVNGGTGGFRSFMGFSRDRKVAIVILSNSANSVDQLSFEVLDYLLTIRNQKFTLHSLEIDLNGIAIASL